jgi:alpha-L-rhamnosidase
MKDATTGSLSPLHTAGLTAMSSQAGASAIALVHLRCEHLADPCGIDTVRPRLSWLIESARRGERQLAYQVLVASTPASLAQDQGELWDSGKVASAQSVLVEYAGKALESRQSCHWKVRVWDKAGGPSAWSAPACWSMGLLHPDDWRGNWIGNNEPTPAARMLRKEFEVTKQVARAMVYYSGLGLSEIYINGQKVGDHVLSPVFSEYQKRVYYVTHDVTAQIMAGRNALGAWLGNGRCTPRAEWMQRFGFPQLQLQLEVDYADGSRDTLVSDGSWHLTSAGPLTANDEFDGEHYDARQEMPGWAEPGFDDSAWQPVELVAGPGGVLSAEMLEPSRVIETIHPLCVNESSPGVYIFDMGQNMVGWCRLVVRGPAGSQVILRHAEHLQPDGSLDVANLRTAKATDIYTLKGQGEEIYEPRFTYHGFRYVEVGGWPGRPTLASLQGRVVHNDVAAAGCFTCSQPTLNRVYRNVVWGVRGNYHGVPTDCPQRDERHGWLGDRAEESRGESYLFNIAALYAKWTRDMADTQRDSGSIPDVCPTSYEPNFCFDDVTWPATSVMVPGMLLDHYGDTALVARQYPSMVKWIDYMCGFLADGLMPQDKFGDWCMPPGNPDTAPGVLATCYFHHCLKLLLRFATLLDKPDDARRFGALAAQLKDGLNRHFYQFDQGCYDNGSQTSCLLPLAFDMVPAPDRPRVFEHLVNEITKTTDDHVGMGLVGGQWLHRVLSAGGRADIAFRLATNTTYPSLGYMVENGATTIWELWDGDRAGPEMNSGNHVMLVGDLITWLHEGLAGIMPDPAQPGFKHIIMKPRPVGDLTFVEATHRSPYGLIASHWKRVGGTFVWQVSIPPNATATVHVPATDATGVTESGQPAGSAQGVMFLRMEHGAAVYEVESGTYNFHSENSTT